jgi:tetratricopeptide (TPR) repeat protein
MPQMGTERDRSPFPDMQRPVFLSGKVMMEDGTPPPDSVVIERICNGTPRPEAYTDSKGRFSFQLGQNTAMMQDASVSSATEPGFGGGGGGFGGRSTGGLGGTSGMGGNRGMSERDLMGCELRASLPGHRSDVVNLSGRRSFDNPDVGTIVLRRLGNVEGTTISATTLQAPKEAKKSYEKGRNALKKNKFDEGQKELEKAVEIYPRYASAWFELGRVHEQAKAFDQAREAYSKALEADPKFVNPYLQIAVLAARENKWQEVADTTDRVLKLNPFDFPQAFFYNSVANYNLGKLDAAEKSVREVQKLDTQHRLPKADHLLGMILAQKRDYPGAAEHMRNYLKFSPQAQDADGVQGVGIVRQVRLQSLEGRGRAAAISGFQRFERARDEPAVERHASGRQRGQASLLFTHRNGSIGT